MAKGRKTGGRRKGATNKVTREFRETVRQLLEDNAHNVGRWLALVAEGDGDAVKPDPGKALDLMSRLAEFAAPKLSRAELTGAGGKDLIPNQSDEQIDRRLAELVAGAATGLAARAKA